MQFACRGARGAGARRRAAHPVTRLHERCRMCVCARVCCACHTGWPQWWMDPCVLCMCPDGRLRASATPCCVCVGAVASCTHVRATTFSPSRRALSTPPSPLCRVFESRGAPCGRGSHTIAMSVDRTHLSIHCVHPRTSCSYERTHPVLVLVVAVVVTVIHPQTNPQRVLMVWSFHH